MEPVVWPFRTGNAPPLDTGPPTVSLLPALGWLPPLSKHWYTAVASAAGDVGRRHRIAESGLLERAHQLAAVVDGRAGLNEVWAIGLGGWHNGQHPNQYHPRESMYWPARQPMTG